MDLYPAMKVTRSILQLFCFTLDYLGLQNFEFLLIYSIPRSVCCSATDGDFHMSTIDAPHLCSLTVFIRGNSLVARRYGRKILHR